ncbi:MAG: acetyltransferase [Chryseolinea sp.]
METSRIILIGGGQHAQVVLDSLMEQGADVLAVFDPLKKADLFGVPQRGEYEPSFEPAALAIVAIGDNAMRKKVSERVSHQFTSTVHPSVIFSRFASMGTGSMVLHGAIVQVLAKIGDHVIVNTGAQIDHDCVIGNFAHIAPRVALCGNVRIGEGAWIGAGATVVPGRTIGRWATVGAGATVVEDVPDYAVVVGTPARIIKYSKP